MPTNGNLLRGRIAEKGYTQGNVAKIIGLSRQAFSTKINNKRNFTVTEIIKLCDLLDIADKDRYFFVR